MTDFSAWARSKLDGGSLLYAGEFDTYNGPWATPEDVRKFSGLLRYSQGTATDGFSATAHGLRQQLELHPTRWRCAPSPPGQIGLFGEIDPTDGGDTSRFMLSTRLAQSDDNGLWKANAYVVKYTLNLFNNFTWFTTNPVLRRSIPSVRRSLLWRRRGVAHLQWDLVQPAEPDGVRRANPL